MTNESPAVPDETIAQQATDVKHDAERDVKHGLAHLEEEAKAIFFTWPEDEVKKFLGWVASKL